MSLFRSGDQAPGEIQILFRRSGPVFHQYSLFGYSPAAQISGHRFGFRHGLIASLSSAGYQHRSLPGRGGLCFGKLNCPVHPSPDQRIERPVRTDPAAQYNDIVLIIRRLVFPRFQRPDHRRGQQALKIDKQSGIDIAEDIAHRKRQSGIGKRDSDHCPADDSRGDQNSEHVRRPEAFMAHQNHIAHRHQYRKRSQEVGGPAHKSLCR